MHERRLFHRGAICRADPATSEEYFLLIVDCFRFCFCSNFSVGPSQGALGLGVGVDTRRERGIGPKSFIRCPPPAWDSILTFYLFGRLPKVNEPTKAALRFLDRGCFGTFSRPPDCVLRRVLMTDEPAGRGLHCSMKGAVGWAGRAWLADGKGTCAKVHESILVRIALETESRRRCRLNRLADLHSPPPAQMAFGRTRSPSSFSSSMSIDRWRIARAPPGGYSSASHLSLCSFFRQFFHTISADASLFQRMPRRRHPWTSAPRRTS